MADPITIIGLVAGLVTFADFGFKVLSASGSVRSSVRGKTPEVNEIDLIINDIRASNSSIKKQKTDDQKLSDDETRIMAMVESSEELYAQLRIAIEKLQARAGVRSRTLESGRVAIRSLLVKTDLRDLAKRLTNLDQRIRGNLRFLLQMDQHSSVMLNLKAIQTSQQALGINHESKLDQIREEILALLNQKQQMDEMHIATQVAQLASLRTKLEILQKEHTTSSTYVRIIENLYFQEVRRRFDQIPVADRRSNEWIYNPSLTSFTPWLESSAQNDGVFYIFGKAGSGKSTLMKYISEDQRTQSSLKNWAGPAKLYVASYFFWNQGNEPQKSRIGLMQSLLYQILRSAPDLIPLVCRDRLYHEVWEIDQLVATFDRIASQTKLDSKFCFFIDGLDEYNGDESEVMPMLRVLSASPHIKVCASSRPGRIYENSLRTSKRAFDIANFTREDMRIYVYTRLAASRKFQILATSEPECQRIVSKISAYADGVWLWVFLVTRDILYEVDRDEGISTLRRIVDEFPSDLEKYFARIIERIKARHKEEMAQTFLVTVHELQPLPLYAFSLLEDERMDPNYALKAPIRSISDAELQLQYPVWRSRVQNWCGDLLVVDNHRHPVFLSHSVDFLHRTVRDFLRDCYHDELKGHLRTKFDPLVSLCKICLYLLKALPINQFSDRDSVNSIIGLTDELLYYAHEVEKISDSDGKTTLMALLDEVDTVNSHHARNITNHWTHARDSTPARGFDLYREGGQCNFLALAVQARLTQYVNAKLRSQPQRIQKRGRPLLDYALRPRRSTPISMPYHSTRDDPSVDVNMVEMLLSHGADPNQPVHLHDGESVWALFLISIYETSRQIGVGYPPSESLKAAWYQTCEVLIKAGARSDEHSPFIDGRNGLSTSLILTRVFQEAEAAKLKEQIDKASRERDCSSRSCTIM